MTPVIVRLRERSSVSRHRYRRTTGAGANMPAPEPDVRNLSVPPARASTRKSLACIVTHPGSQCNTSVGRPRCLRFPGGLPVRLLRLTSIARSLIVPPEPSTTITPAIRAAERAGISFELLRYTHYEDAPSYGLEAAEALGLAPDSVFKTLVIVTDGGRLAVALVPVDHSLDLKAAADALGARRVALAPAADATRATGYVVGGISPLGQRRRLPTLIDESALSLSRIHVSAGRRGLEIALDPADLVRLCEATVTSIARE